YGVGVPEAVDAARACFAKEDRQRGSIYTTAETVMAPFADQAHVEMTGEVDPPTLISGANTLYLCAPSHEQQRLRPLFAGVVRDILAEVYERVTRSGRPLHPPLLLLLDEAANIAPLPELDAVASTAAGQGIQLVTIWQDIAQITARYGARGATVVNNHRAKVFLSGISDPGTLDQASHLIGEAERPIRTRTSGAAGGATTSDTPGYRRLVPPDALRRIPPGHGVLVYGSLPPARITLRAEPIGTDRGSVPRRSRWAMMGADGR
ncbi:MAG: type IV secretory system conjugative DNA transfer family protein, partial [Acidimicrobiales bacterium]